MLVGLNTIAFVTFGDQFKSITSQHEPVPVYKGDALGYFRHGGSINILLFQPGVYASIRVPQGQGN